MDTALAVLNELVVNDSAVITIHVTRGLVTCESHGVAGYGKTVSEAITSYVEQRVPAPEMTPDEILQHDA